MSFFDGIIYNLRGLRWAMKSPKLLMLGLTRFFAMIFLAVVFGSVIIAYRQEILGLLWIKPQSDWLILIWYLLSWIVSLSLFWLSTILSYLAAQILFGVIIMDIMSQVTEKLATGKVAHKSQGGVFQQFVYLVRQEVPRAVFPILLTLLLVVIGWLTPLGPPLTVVSSFVAITFLAWDNTDLIPSRQLIPFKHRFRFLMKALPFHLGFGLWFLIPVLNVLFLSFAPIGATLYHVDLQKREDCSTNSRID
jgi:CysZ protein